MGFARLHLTTDERDQLKVICWTLCRLEEVSSHRKSLPILSIIIPIISSRVINTLPEISICVYGFCVTISWMPIDLLSIPYALSRLLVFRSCPELIGCLDRLTGPRFLSGQLRLGLCLHKFCRDKPHSGGEAALYIKTRTVLLAATIS